MVSRAALDAHSVSPHIEAFRTKFRAIAAGPPDVFILDPMPEGDPAKGALAG